MVMVVVAATLVVVVVEEDVGGRGGCRSDFCHDAHRVTIASGDVNSGGRRVALREQLGKTSDREAEPCPINRD